MRLSWSYNFHRVKDVDSEKTGIVMGSASMEDYYDYLCGDVGATRAQNLYRNWQEMFGYGLAGTNTDVLIVKLDVPERQLTLEQYIQHVRKWVEDPAYTDWNEMPEYSELKKQYEQVPTKKYISAPAIRLKIIGKKPWCCIKANIRRIIWTFRKRACHFMSTYAPSAGSTDQ